MSEKGGAVRLLQHEDVGRKNAHGKPLIGWRDNSQGMGGLHNPRGFALLRVVVQNYLNGEPSDLYDQPILVENTGSIVICQAGERIGLIRNFRMVGERLFKDDVDYVRRLNDEGRWEELASTLGTWKWELPRGIPPTQSYLNDIVIDAAKIEAQAEAGFRISNERVLGRVNTNPTFFAHAQYVVGAEISSVGDQDPEELEIIGEAKLFAPTEIRQMVTQGKLDDGLTLSALAIAGYQF